MDSHVGGSVAVEKHALAVVDQGGQGMEDVLMRTIAVSMVLVKRRAADVGTEVERQTLATHTDYSALGHC